ncbi:MAG: cytochrome oxidase assembly protein [Pirellulaceae bacterium]|nr:MAG: cytochrome oxidase assembly protein [Pirellulaceae bacterium]
MTECQPAAKDVAGPAAASAGPKIIHRLAVGLTVVVFPLIWVGGLVTTYDAGMAVPDWPTTYGWNMFAYPLSTWLSGPFDLMVEHSHRLLGSMAGLVAIALLIVAYRYDGRPWFVGWCVLLLLAVIAQGILGGVRVLFDERVIAKVHGCVGPAFFAMAAVTATMASSWWRRGAWQQVATGAGGRKRTVAVISSVLLAIVFLQLVLGAQLRHLTGWETHRQFTALTHAHLGTAGLLAVGVVVVALLAWLLGVERSVRRPAMALVGLVLVQLALGGGTWIVNYALPWQELNKMLASYTIHAKGFVESLIITAHMATGSLILAVTAVTVARAWRCRWVALRGSP